MTDLELKAKVETILSAPVLTLKAVEELNTLILGPKKTLKAAKPRQTSNDRETVKALQLQIKALKEQLQPNQAPEHDQEKLLEDLFQLQLKRQQEIIQNGIDVTIGLSATPFKCLKKSDDTVYLLAGTNVAASMHIKANGGLLGIITSVSQESGRLKCDLFCPSSTASVYQKTSTATGHNLQPSGISEPCKVTGNTLTFYSKQFESGTIISVSGKFVEVVGTKTEGNLVVHSVKPFEMKQQAVAGARTHYTETLDLPKNYSVYHSCVL